MQKWRKVGQSKQKLPQIGRFRLKVQQFEVVAVFQPNFLGKPAMGLASCPGGK